jgi:hypothetical protein
MAHIGFVIALAAIAGVLPVVAANQPIPAEGAPPGTAETRYCMRVEAFTGSRIELVKCWTREEWTKQGVDVDKEWAEEGVRVIA